MCRDSRSRLSSRAKLGSPLVGRSLKASPIRSDLGIIIVAIKKPGAGMTFNPASSAVLDTGDVLITLGHRQQLDRLDVMAGSAR